MEREDKYPREEARCQLCGGRHVMGDCGHLGQITLKGGKQAVAGLQLCFRCLKEGHNARSCASTRQCTVSGCCGDHATILHAAPMYRKETGPSHDRRAYVRELYNEGLGARWQRK